MTNFDDWKADRLSRAQWLIDTADVDCMVAEMMDACADGECEWCPLWVSGGAHNRKCGDEAYDPPDERKACPKTLREWAMEDAKEYEGCDSAEDKQ